MTLDALLKKYRKKAKSKRELGGLFELLMCRYLLTDPKYKSELKRVYLWKNFHARGEFGGTDTGIDLVAETNTGDYWAIQCKCYEETTTVDKEDVNTFLATSNTSFNRSKSGRDRVTFSRLILISTTNLLSRHAKNVMGRQNNTQVDWISFNDLRKAGVNWKKLDGGIFGGPAQISFWWKLVFGALTLPFLLIGGTFRLLTQKPQRKKGKRRRSIGGRFLTRLLFVILVIALIIILNRMMSP